MALALCLFLPLLLAVALPARAAQAAPLQVRGADLDHVLSYLQVLVNDTLKIVENAGAEPVAEGGAASQPIPSTDPLGDAEGVSAGSTFPGPLVDVARKPSSHHKDEIDEKASPLAWLNKVLKPLESPAGRNFPAPLLIAPRKPGSLRRGPPRGKNKGTGKKKFREPNNILKQTVMEVHKGHGMDREALWKAAFPQGREAMPGTVTGVPSSRRLKGIPAHHGNGSDLCSLLDWDHELENLVNGGLKTLPEAGDNPVAESDLASQPTFRIEPLGDAEGVSAGRTFPAPLVDVARKPSSHRRGPPAGKNKAKGHKKAQEPSKRMGQLLREMEQAGQDNPVAESDLASQPTFRIEPLGDAEGVSAGRTFPAPLVDVARKPSSHRRGPPAGKNKAKGHKKAQEPSKRMGQLLREMEQAGQGMDREALWKASFPEGREAIPGMGTVTGDWDRDMASLGGLAQDSLKSMENSADNPVAESDLASQPTFRIEPLGDAEGVSAGRTFPAPLVDVARKPSSHRRGPPAGKNKAKGHKKAQEPSKRMGQLLREMEQAGQDNPVAESDLASQPTFRIEPLGDAEGVSAGRTFPAPLVDVARKPSSHRRGPPAGKNKAKGHKKAQEPSKRMGQLLREMEQAGQDNPVAESDLASQPTFRIEPLGDAEGVSAGRTFPAPLVDVARKPSSHRRGPPAGKNKAKGHKKAQEPSKRMGQLLREMEQAGQDNPVAESDLASQPTFRIEPLGDAEGVSAGRTFPAPLVDVARKPSSHRRGPPAGKNKAKGHKKAQEPSKRMGQLLREMEQAGQDNPVAESDLASQPTFRIEPLGDAEVMDETSQQKEAHPGGSSGSVPTSAAGRKAMPGTGTGTGDAASTTAPVPDSQKGIGRGCRWEARCLLQLMADVLFFNIFFMLFCVGIWCFWKIIQNASAASQDRPNSSVRENRTCHLACPCQCPLSLPQLHYPLIGGDMLPPPRTGPSVSESADPDVWPGLKVGPSCQGRA
ncbi:uncharacterized protein LOC128793906 isoform X5 [Vidua chalybeata]|uniref:uncharacterized protein LOC128793906 isoform X5 n=1 Tax=Vidua chalybeata TaxID=81927 RepID=UPI0023A89DF0|nr:uncharacterized protein LOC128793906 isoform X5 [Vidua chalybeata]